MADLVAICVCTHKRPKMLRACLDSITNQRIPEDCDVRLIVVDNEPTPAAMPIVDAFAHLGRMPIHYLHQPRRGIAVARNTAMEEAERISAQWVIFIDDDEVAAPGWLAALMNKGFRTTPVLAGWQRFDYPRPMPPWVFDRTKMPDHGGTLKTAQTNNVRIDMKIMRAGLRFNERLGLMGGEDGEYFEAARAMGFEIRQTAHAITIEAAHSERLTLRGQLTRAYWHGASDYRRLALRYGRGEAALRSIPAAPLKMAGSALQIAVAPALIVMGPRKVRHWILRAGIRSAKAAGRVAAFAGYLPQPYAVTVGR